jgi:UDP-N-acetylmuramoyl-L-alanyl-D-glutamate--2,6-diaminopimelate ligase
MEVSSHSLDQRRIDPILFDTAIFTNISGEHLDYHKDIKNYFGAKAKIFDSLKKGGVAILNADDKMVAGLKRSIRQRSLTYAVRNKADIAARGIKTSGDGTEFTAVTPDSAFEIRTRLIGEHNISNILAAVAAALNSGVAISKIQKGVASLKLVPGRLEAVDSGQPFKVFVDFAHTEDALRNVLGLVRSIVCSGSVITVFGCGGNRDRAKRPLMGRVACRLSDKVIITSDNPRFEEPGDIISEIEAGVKGRFKNYYIVEDRREAIAKAIANAAKGDIVVIAGKGHEKYQIVGDRVMPFNDCEVARNILKRKYESK